MTSSCPGIRPSDSCPNGVCQLKKKNPDQLLISPSQEKCPSGITTCPNSDPEFNKIIGENMTPEERSNLFIICVLTRTLLYSGVYVYRDKPWMPLLVGILALMSIIQLTRPTKNRQWWSKRFQLVMAVLILISAIAVKLKGLDSRSMAALLFISLIGGVIQRIQTKLC